MRRAALAIVLLAGTGSVAAQELPPWVAQMSLGSSDIHDAPNQGIFAGARFGRGLGARRLFHVDLGYGLGKADAGFSTLTLGLEGRPFPSGRVTPYVRLESGWIFEGSERYVLVGAGAGLSVRLNPRLFVRAGALWCGHGFDEGAYGPSLYHAGVELRF